MGPGGAPGRVRRVRLGPRPEHRGLCQYWQPLIEHGDASVVELAKPFEMSQPAISKHLKVLEGAGLISRGRDAQRRPCRLETKQLAAATGWIEEYRKVWEANFQRLDDLLGELKTEKKSRKQT